jgi:hypothetical protein
LDLDIGSCAITAIEEELLDQATPGFKDLEMDSLSGDISKRGFYKNL